MEAGATGLEPAASGVTGRRSNQLNYAPASGQSECTRSSAPFQPHGEAVEDDALVDLARWCTASMDRESSGLA
jgi:hypothetical protein